MSGRGASLDIAASALAFEAASSTSFLALRTATGVSGRCCLSSAIRSVPSPSGSVRSSTATSQGSPPLIRALPSSSVRARATAAACTSSFSVRPVDPRIVYTPAASDHSSPTLQRAGQDNLRTLHLPENELEGLREGRVVFYYHHPLRRYTSCPTNRPSTTLTEKG